MWVCSADAISCRMNMLESAWWCSLVRATTRLWSLCGCLGTAVHSSVDLVDKVVWSRRILNQSSWSLNEKKRSLIFGSHVSSRLAMELIWSFEFQGITNWLLLPKAHLCQPRAASKVRLIGLTWSTGQLLKITARKITNIFKVSQKHE